MNLQIGKELIRKQLFFFAQGSRRKNKKQIAKEYEAKPDYFKQIRIMDPPNLHPNNKDLVFPINIPLRFNYIRRTKRRTAHLIDFKDNNVINFKSMNGNQILLQLERCNELKNHELMAGLFQLHQRYCQIKDKKEVSWKDHLTILECVEVIKKNISQYNSREVATCILNMKLLEIEDVDLWSKLQREMLKCLPTFNKTQFLCVFETFMTSEKEFTNSEIKSRLASLLPVHLHQFSPDNIIKSYHIVFQQNLMTDYLFNEHFMMIFWKRHNWFKVKGLAQIIDILINYQLYLKQDMEFWVNEFLPKFKGIFKSETNVIDIRLLILNLDNLKNKIIELTPLIDPIIDEAHLQLEFASTSYVNAQKNQFINIVKDDMEYFKQLQLQKLIKKQSQQQQAN